MIMIMSFQGTLGADGVTDGSARGQGALKLPSTPAPWGVGSGVRYFARAAVTKCHPGKGFGNRMFSLTGLEVEV